ncbi:MAG: (d)CMP kinase [Balneolaceae bacterium]
MIIVIDGLSGSGKSSTAKAVAEKLGMQYLDSGALYRAVTYIWLEEEADEKLFLEKLFTKDIRFTYQDHQFHVWVDGEEVTGKIRTGRVSDHVSKVASISEVRNYVNDLMRKAVREDSYIADGRDLGSVVFPDADLKFFMKASIDVRARRRHAEMSAGGENISLSEVEKNLNQRDHLDSTREIDPLRKPADAIEIDTSGVTFEEQVSMICSIITEKLNIN